LGRCTLILYFFLSAAQAMTLFFPLVFFVFLGKETAHGVVAVNPILLGLPHHLEGPNLIPFFRSVLRRMFFFFFFFFFFFAVQCSAVHMPPHFVFFHPRIFDNQRLEIAETDTN
jgi:hypothetical protein